MFNKELVSSDKFLDMPVSSQALFFHLGMNADDEGFVSSPKRISRSIGCSGDDLKILIAKSFVVSFDSGVIVIKEWSSHNQIRKDRFTPTIHKEEKAQLQVTDIQQPQPSGNQVATTRQPSVVKVSSVEVSIKKEYTEQDRCEHTIDMFEGVAKSEKPKKVNTARENLFEEFWIAYGRKGNKKRSKVLFLKLKDEQVVEIQNNLPAYLFNTKENLKFRKDAQVYLNPANEHWNDVVFIEVKEKSADVF